MMDETTVLQLRDKLCDLAYGIGYEVELESKMADYIKAKHLNKKGNLKREVRPAGDCNYENHRIRVREGKALEGQVSTLVHELCHAMGIGGLSSYSMLGSDYLELVCESVTQFVTQMVGIDRTKKTAPRVFFGYHATGFLVSPVTQALTNVFADHLGYDRPTLKQEDYKFEIEVVQ